MAKISLLVMTKTIQTAEVTYTNKFKFSIILGGGEWYFQAQKIWIKMNFLPD